jgi:hypothetical protein
LLPLIHDKHRCKGLKDYSNPREQGIFLENPQIMVDLGNMDEVALNRPIIKYN